MKIPVYISWNSSCKLDIYQSTPSSSYQFKWFSHFNDETRSHFESISMSLKYRRRQRTSPCYTRLKSALYQYIYCIVCMYMQYLYIEKSETRRLPSSFITICYRLHTIIFPAIFFTLTLSTYFALCLHLSHTLYM